MARRVVRAVADAGRTRAAEGNNRRETEGAGGLGWPVAHTDGRGAIATPAPRASGRLRRRLVRDAKHQPISVRALAQALPAKSFRTVTWREGTAASMSSRFARGRVRAAQNNQPRAEEWVLIEWPCGEAEPSHY